MNTQAFRQLAGTYFLINPYHKNKKKLPFNVESDGYVSTVEYKGSAAYLVQQYYSLKTLKELIESGYVKEGRVKFPRCKQNIN